MMRRMYKQGYAVRDAFERWTLYLHNGTKVGSCCRAPGPSWRVSVYPGPQPVHRLYASTLGGAVETANLYRRTMDPNATLDRILELCDDNDPDAVELCKLVHALNEWIMAGGALPDAWRVGKIDT